MRIKVERTLIAAPVMIACAALFMLRVPGQGIQGIVARSQSRFADDRADRRAVSTVTIPVTLRGRGSELIDIGGLTVLEDGAKQQVLSVRGANTSPLTLAVLIQDDVVPSVGNEIKTLGNFINRLPAGSRVLVGYIRAGSLQVRQRFTSNLERAAGALRTPFGNPSSAPYNPYVEIVEGLKRFESQPVGRRAMLVITDGLDLSRGFDSSTPGQSPDLQRAINEAQRRGVAVYAFYAPTVGATAHHNLFLVSNAQGSLTRLADETGGHAFFQGLAAPVSFDPFLKELDLMLAKQLAVTYLSTTSDKGFHRIEVQTGVADLKAAHPAGYTKK
jgi:hypothetical protein